MQHTPLDVKRETFIEAISEEMETLGMRGILVFDCRRKETFHYPMRSHTGHLELIYAPSNLCADQYILEYLVNADSVKNIRVVTSDRDLGMQVKNLGAKVEDVGTFLRRLSKKRKSHEAKYQDQKPLSATSYEIERLLQIFEERMDQPDSENEY